MRSHARPGRPTRCASPAWKGALPPLALTLAGLCGGLAQAQQASARSTSLSTSVDVLGSYAVDSRNGGLRGGDFVGELRPGIRLDSRSARIVGSLDYSLSLMRRSRSLGGENIHNQLNGSFFAEAVEKWMYVDGSASVSQQAASAFGQQSASGSALDNPNRTEVGTVTLSPYVRGVLGSAVNYEARFTGSATNGRRSIAADSTVTTESLSLSSLAGASLIGWGLVATHQSVDFRAGRETQSERVIASLSFNPDADLNLALRGGQEATNVADLQRTRYDNWGAGLTWRPSPRTRAQLNVDERYFGRSHSVLLEHRMASTSMQFSSTRDVSNSADANAYGQRTTIYQLLFALRASTQPDETLRDQEVLAELRAAGVDPNTAVSGGFINTAVTIQQRQLLALTYSGRRVLASVQAFATRSDVIDAAALAASNEAIRQWGYLVTASYRLTPTASIALNGSRLLTAATATRAGTELKSVSLSLADQIGRRTTASLTARYSVFNSATDPYREAALTAMLSHRF